LNPSVSVQRILFDVARRIGLVPTGDDANLDPNKAYELLTFINQRLREGWESYDFLDITLLEQRAFRDDFDSTLCYQTGDIVWDPITLQYYTALATTTGGPLSNTSIWQPNTSVTPRWIPFWQTNKTPIGTPFQAWTQNPYENPNFVTVPFKLSQRGLEFTQAQNVTSVWLMFRQPCPAIGTDPWTVGTTYNLWDPVLDGADSYYSLIDNNLGNDPALSPSQWQLFRIPWVLQPFVTQAVFSDSLIVDGQNQKAPDELNKAYGLLQSEYDKQILQTGQMQHWTGTTR
jgi:hypothetical protein